MKHKIKFRILFVLAVFLLVGCVKQNDKVNAEETIMKEDNAYETTFEEMQEYKMVSETNPVEKGTKTVNDLIAENNEKNLETMVQMRNRAKQYRMNKVKQQWRKTIILYWTKRQI